MNYFEHHIGDYDEATAHLTACEDGIYCRLIRKYMATEKPLPPDLKALQRLVRARSRDEKEAVQTVLEEFFELREDGWHQHRCDETIARYQDKQRKAQASANARWNAHRTQSEGNANASADAMRTHSEGNANQSPNTNHQSPIEKQEGDPTRDAGAYGPLAKALRLKAVDVQPGNPDFRAWVDSGLTEGEALAGLEIARTSKPAPERMPWGYLSKVLATQRKTASAVPAKTERAPTAAERRAAWNAELQAVIANADGRQPREIDMGIIDATGTHE
ncbi:YdaU family protein [Achromobacter xylosoxidans]|uniref:YdaU family protein n=1 Tax=Alcaligenes xylosoxydans xylosoxydans TaxID=85698 RepID=UPI000B48BD0E|nr:YdaU family protein [Achromobacter xylosoxidans]